MRYFFILILLVSLSCLRAQVGTVYWYKKISELDGNFQGTIDSDDRFAHVGYIGDINHDGLPDIGVGAPHDDDGGSNRGAVWILFLKQDGSVLSHQKISFTSGNFSGILDNEDYFGWSVQPIGDFDNDSIPDVAVGAYSDDDGGGNRGALWLLYLNSNGTVKDWDKISDTQGNFTGTLDNNDFFGIQSCSIGDLNNDGVTDLAVGAMFDDDGGADRGAVWILFMNADGTVNSHQKISSGNGGFTGTLQNNDRFGRAVGLIGDLDDDGVQDIIVGGNGYDSFTGAAWIIYLNADGTAKGQVIINDPAHSWIPVNSNFGLTLTGLEGDFNGDMVEDVIITAHGDNGNGVGKGAFWVLFLNTNGTIAGGQKVSSTEGNFFATLMDYDAFATNIGYMGDINGDGKKEVCVGSDLDDESGTDAGCAWVISLCTDTDCGPMYVFEDNTPLFSIRPNPCNDVLYLDNPSGDERQYMITDCYGREIMTGIAGRGIDVLDMKGFESGMYFILLEGDKSHRAVKIIKN